MGLEKNPRIKVELRSPSELTTCFIIVCYIIHIVHITFVHSCQALFSPQYCDQLDSADAQEAAEEVLAPLIRCQHLSLYWLSAPLLASEGQQLLSRLKPKLGLLLSARVAHRQHQFTTIELSEAVLTALASWSLPKREFRHVKSVTLTALFSISELKEKAQQCAEQQEAMTLDCPLKSPPLGGVCWQLKLDCQWDAAAKAVDITVSVTPCNLGEGTSCSFDCSISCEAVSTGLDACTLCEGRESYWSDFFEVGLMAGGWDEVAWAAKDWSASGALEVTLKVTKVGHSVAMACELFGVFDNGIWPRL